MKRLDYVVYTTFSMRLYVYLVTWVPIETRIAGFPKESVTRFIEIIWERKEKKKNVTRFIKNKLSTLCVAHTICPKFVKQSISSQLKASAVYYTIGRCLTEGKSGINFYTAKGKYKKGKKSIKNR